MKMKPGSVKGLQQVGSGQRHSAFGTRARSRCRTLNPITRACLGPFSSQTSSYVKEAAMLIIAGKLYMAPQERDKWVEAHYDVIKRARSAPGCLELYISADPVEEGRVNMFEQ